MDKFVLHDVSNNDNIHDRITVDVKNGGRFFWFLKLRIQCQYTLFSYVVSYNISTLCCKLVLGWPRPNATNDEANKWGNLVYGVPEA